MIIESALILWGHLSNEAVGYLYSVNVTMTSCVDNVPTLLKVYQDRGSKPSGSETQDGWRVEATSRWIMGFHAHVVSYRLMRELCEARRAKIESGYHVRSSDRRYDELGEDEERQCACDALATIVQRVHWVLQ